MFIINHLKKTFNLSIDIYKYFNNNFTAHSDGIEKLILLGYKVKDIFFKELLSGDFLEIHFTEINKLTNSFTNSKSELVPVLVLKKGNNNEALIIELHSKNNVF